MMKNVTITIKVTYDESTVFDSDMFLYSLENAVDRAVDDGMLSPTGGEIVDEFTVEID